MSGIDTFWMMPGETYPVVIERRRSWWQFWKPKVWHERATAVVPMPDHPNCRCTIAKEIKP